MLQDTIAGIATAMGEGAISIIRVSGKESIKIVENNEKNSIKTL